MSLSSSSPTGSANFSSIPVLDYSLVTTARAEFISQLRHALTDVGFLYLSNAPVSPSDISSLIDYIPKLFELPQVEKDKIRIAYSPHFHGYSTIGSEFTKGKVDRREKFSFGTPHRTRWREGEGMEEYLRMWGPCQVHIGSSELLWVNAHSDTPDITVARGVTLTRIPCHFRTISCPS